MSQPRSINTTQEHVVCDVCARTLLRGEQTETFVGGGRRYSVCELCKPHALNEGWMREGAIPDYQGGGDRVQRRRSLLRRRRGKDGADERGDEIRLARCTANARPGVVLRRLGGRRGRSRGARADAGRTSIRTGAGACRDRS